MPVSYADQDLLLVPPELQAFLERYLPTVETVLFSDFLGVANTNRLESLNVNAKNRVGIARPNYPAPPKLKINSLYWPTGAARWGRFLGICNTETKDKILDAVGESSPGAKPLILTDESQTPAVSISRLMHLLPPRRISCLTQSSTEDADQLWLLPLVDDRWQWQFRSSINLSAVPGDYWFTLFNSLASVLYTSIDSDNVPDEYLFPDPLECTRKYESAAAILDAAAHSVGQRLVVLDNMIKTVGWESSQETLDANLALKWTQVAGGSFDAHPMLKTVNVMCPHYVTNVQSCGWRPYSADLDEGRGVEGTEIAIHTTAAANFDTFGDSTPNNNDELTTLAEKIAEDLKLSAKFYDYTFNGLLKWVPCGFDDHVEWNMGALADDGTYLAQTRVQSHSYNFGIDEMLHQIEDRVFPVGNYIAKTATSIPLMSSNSPGIGEATIYEWEESTNELTSTTVTVTVRNMMPIDVADDVWVQLMHDGCQLFVSAEECPA